MVIGDESSYRRQRMNRPASRQARAKRSKAKAIDDQTLCDLTGRIEHIKALIRAAVKHLFRVIKRRFGDIKARYWGLVKNDGQVQHCSPSPIYGWHASIFCRM